MFHQEFCVHNGSNYQTHEEDKIIFVDFRMLDNMDLIKHKYVKAPILISLNWDVDFHVHTNASLLALGVMLVHNLTRKHDQLIVFCF
jgi:hypothetical protein